MNVQREQLLAHYCADRTIDRRNAVVDAYRDLCVRGARKFKRAGNDRADLEQVAAVGLIKAAANYRHDMQTPFTAYAWIMIVGELMHYVRDHERIVRVPRSLRTMEKRYAETWERLTSAHHREPSTGEMAAALGVRVEAIEELRALRRVDRVPLADAEPGEGTQAIDTLADHRDGVAIEERITLSVALAQLGDRERAIVVGTYGVGLTQTELGERLGLSQSHVSKVLKSALRKMSSRVA